MSCNGCRVLRKGCSQDCILRPCLQWIQTPEAQANATVFVAKFFGRAGLMSFISAVPDDQRQSLFQSLLFEAAGRTINPVNGAVGLLWTGNWHVCQASVETILRGGTLRPVPEQLNGGDSSELLEPIVHTRSNGQKLRRGCGNELDLSLKQRLGSPSMNSEDSVTTCLDAGLRDYNNKFDKNNDDYNYNYNSGEREVQILNLFN